MIRSRVSVGIGSPPTSVEATLHDGHVVPAAELECRLALDTDRAEPVPPVQPERRGVPRCDARHDRVMAGHDGAPNKLGEDQAAEARAAGGALDVDGGLYRVRERGPRPA